MKRLELFLITGPALPDELFSRYFKICDKSARRCKALHCLAAFHERMLGPLQSTQSRPEMIFVVRTLLPNG